MLLIAKSLRELNFRQLMDVYAEGNEENALDQYPQLPAEQGMLEAEQDFYAYLQQSFFSTPGALYAVWSQEGCYVSALRLEPYRDGFLMEAVETAPQHRRRGYARKLLTEILSYMGGHRLYVHIHKRNVPSIRLHQNCGFQKIADHAVYIDGSVNSLCDTYLYPGGVQCQSN